MAQPQSGRRPIQILYVDDEDDLRLVVQRVLSREPDFVVKELNSGIALLELLADPECKPDLILLDVIMPGMDGLETARRVRVIDSKLPIIFFTANGELTDKWPADDGAILGTLNKPFHFRTLAQDIRRMFDGESLESE
ncbi:response regulator [Sphingobium lignivorans]|uniref:CheY-like chemotaxis protein n=1 Tax=Sphingobium lignivorans TaxID=2735886 RepID=A0ABR6NDT8_9SPHN|nr:response regulator [Sphingobium lignivorans]MBB5985445.1 CheY-like chemotaxis protein [Sphingobium lignivorans]